MSTTVTKASYFDAIYDILPSELRAGINDLLGRATHETTVRNTLDQLIRFSLGQIISTDDLKLRKEWELQLPKAQQALHALQSPSETGKKRDREDDVSTSETYPSKKVKRDTESTDDIPLYTLHAISTASPVRKKVNITIHQKSICFINPTSGAQEASIILKSAFRAFLISTPGKSKPHWTVVILADTDANQTIFGLDAVPPFLMTTAHPAAPQSNPKGTEAKPALKTFLSYLPPHVPVLEPSTSQFRSASGEPYIDAYLRAKDGHLLFFKEGILFGEKKPCMWIGIDEIESVRTLSATGRTFSIFIKRVEHDDEGIEDIEGEETEFSLIEGKHQDSVSQWVHDNKHRFGTRHVEPPKAAPKESGAVDELVEEDESPEKPADEDSEDLEDDDYQSESDSDGGSASSVSSRGEGGEELEEEQESDGEGEEEADQDADEEEILDPAKHPLMAPGAVPRLSKAAINSVIGMVELDLMGGLSSKSTHNMDEDELDDEDADSRSEDIDELE